MGNTSSLFSEASVFSFLAWRLLLLALTLLLVETLDTDDMDVLLVYGRLLLVFRLLRLFPMLDIKSMVVQ